MRAIKTTPDLSSRQDEVLSRQKLLKAKHKLSNLQFQQMLEMLTELTPAERRRLKDPDFITEDEADIVVSIRRLKEPTVPLEKVLAEAGIPPRRRSA